MCSMEPWDAEKQKRNNKRTTKGPSTSIDVMTHGSKYPALISKDTMERKNLALILALDFN